MAARRVAKLLLEEIIAWARAEKLDSLVLHASEEGRALYEQLGFQSSHEMRLPAKLINSQPEIRDPA